MATFEALCASWSGGSTYIRLNMDQAGNDNNGWNVNWSIQSRDTHTSISGTWDWSRGGGIGGASGSVGAVTGLRTIQSSTVYVSCDVNGNGSINSSASMDVFYGIGNTSGTLSLGRIPLAPSISALIADQVSTTSARVGIEISSFGHGTSAAMYPQYRVQGDVNWISIAAQNDAAGYNYYTITGLKSNKTYEYRAVAYNNNSDQSISGVQTFKTKSGAKLVFSDGTVQDRVVRQILPSGVVSDRIVTKIT